LPAATLERLELLWITPIVVENSVSPLTPAVVIHDCGKAVGISFLPGLSGFVQG
jgi:hypothetical protein